MQLKIEYIHKNDLKPYASNTKIHTPEQIQQIKNSILQFGFNDPIAIWHDNEIVEGHGRLLAAMQIPEIIQVPAIRLDDLTDQQRKAYAIVHNALILQTEFDLERLQQELDQIQQLDMADFGFDIRKEIAQDHLDQMLTDEPIEKDKKIKLITCPCCGKSIKKEELQYVD